MLLPFLFSSIKVFKSSCSIVIVPIGCPLLCSFSSCPLHSTDFWLSMRARESTACQMASMLRKVLSAGILWSVGFCLASLALLHSLAAPKMQPLYPLCSRKLGECGGSSLHQDYLWESKDLFLPLSVQGKHSNLSAYSSAFPSVFKHLT